MRAMRSPMTAAIDLELVLARPAEKAKAAALALKWVSQAAALIGQMRELDLQCALLGCARRPKSLQDQPGAVERLGIPCLLQVALLDRERRARSADRRCRLRGFSRAQRFHRPCRWPVGCGPDLADKHNAGLHDLEIDGAGEADGLFGGRSGASLVLRYACSDLARREHTRDKARSRSPPNCRRWCSGRPTACRSVVAPTGFSPAGRSSPPWSRWGDDPA